MARARWSEILSNEWGRDVAASRRAAEAARDRQYQLEQGASQHQLLAHAAWQNDVLIQQNTALIAQGERTIELLSYLADRAYEDGVRSAQQEAPASGEAGGLG